MAIRRRSGGNQEATRKPSRALDHEGDVGRFLEERLPRGGRLLLDVPEKESTGIRGRQKG